MKKKLFCCVFGQHWPELLPHERVEVELPSEVITVFIGQERQRINS